MSTADVQRAPCMRVKLLGGFRVDRDDLAAPVSNWQRRSAKTLIKVLATAPGHALHREQLLEILWPDSDFDSAVNSFAKALHAARRAFQPTLLPREQSPYLLIADSMVALDHEHVRIDADQFEQLAHQALRLPETGALELALAAYRGDLLPEDRYADWCTLRRDMLADLRVRMLLKLADLLEARGAYNDCASRLRAVLQQDPAREEVHRRLMQLYAEMGTPDQAVRQFHACEETLRRELDIAPAADTVAVYQAVLAHRMPSRAAWASQTHEHAATERSASSSSCSRDPWVGRDDIVDGLRRQLLAPGGRTGMVLLSGEAGIGKTRLLQEFARVAGDDGAVVLWGGGGAYGTDFGCGPIAIALERYVAALPADERQELAGGYPALRQFIPSLVTDTPTPQRGDGDDVDLVPAVVRLLTDIGRRRPVLLVLGDVCDADVRSLDVIRYLAHLASDRRWLLMAAARDEEVEPRTPAGRVLGACMRVGLCRKIELPCLTRAQCDELVSAVLPAGVESRELLDQIYGLTCGNPLFIREVADDISKHARPDASEHDGDPPAIAGGRVPSGVRSLAETQLASLDTTLQRVLCLAAAADTAEISVADLRACAAMLDPPVGEGALLDALDRAVEVRLLEERGSGYAFRRPLVQWALNERLSRHRRAQLGAALRRARRADQAELTG